MNITGHTHAWIETKTLKIHKQVRHKGKIYSHVKHGGSNFIVEHGTGKCHTVLNETGKKVGEAILFKSSI